MAPIQPQKAGAKIRLQDAIHEIGSESSLETPQDTPSRTLSPAGKYHLKSVLPLEPPSDGFHRVAIGSQADALGRTVSPLSFRTASPGPGLSFPPSPSQPPPPVSRLRRMWNNQAPVIYMFLSQMFAALMNLCARLLEVDPVHPMHPFQLLFIRMSTTALISSAYMYWKHVPDFPLGPRGFRGFLVVRGLSGFIGIFSMWYSIMYLPLAEATVITFLVPSVTSYICHVILHDPFTRKEQIASLIALLGVVLIARPVSLFPGLSSVDVHPAVNATMEAVPQDTPSAAVDTAPPPPGSDIVVSTGQRLIAVAVALMGVLGTAGAFTALRAIGTRAHSLISVNYFSTAGTIVSSLVLGLAPILQIGQPGLRFGLPQSLGQWGLLLGTCFCGFGTQIYLTMGLGLERSNRATAMVYTNMLFAAGFDRYIFGNEMGLVTLVGCGMIIGSALWVALSKPPPPPPPQLANDTAARTAAAGDIEIGCVSPAVAEVDRSGRGDNTDTGESMPMLGAVDSDDEEIVDLQRS